LNPSTVEYRGDLTIRQVEGSFAKKVVTQGKDVSALYHLGVSPDGTSAAYVVPGINPTTMTLVKIPEGTTVWTEADVPYKTMPYHLGNDHVIVGRSYWTGVAMDVAYELVSTSNQASRVKLGEQVRHLGFDRERPIVALLKHPYSPSGYKGPVKVSTWSMTSGVATPSKELTLPSVPESIHQVCAMASCIRSSAVVGLDK
jgi:hypothetical protein